MKDFVIRLYANENFPIYLGAIIIVLLIAFFVVFFLGRKDKKKIEMTQRLEAINADAFKEVSTPIDASIDTVETPNPVEQPNSVVPDTSTVNIAETIPEVPTSNVEITTEEVQPKTMPVEPNIEISVPPVIASPVEHPVVDVQPDTQLEQIIDEKPVLNFNQEPIIKPYVPEPDISNFNTLASSIENELNELEKQQEIAKPYMENTSRTTPVVETIPIIEMPVVPNLSETVPPAVMPVVENQKPILEPVQTDPINIAPAEVKPTKVMTDVFSSVYAPKKTVDPFLEETMAIELPRLKDAPEINDEN
ncbi:MAG: hypothetical protein E7167_00865 [Firmicutes bacterium]|nr:hypothetical protein [Bacillota bacterium]